MNKEKHRRTKKNIKPSSSQKAAELLTNLPLSENGTPSTDGALFSMGREFNALDPVTRIALRKVAKKDSTTKLKGLHEIEQQVQNKSKEEALALWKVYRRLYEKLYLDDDNRVRFDSHELALEILSNVSDAFAAVKPVLHILFLARHGDENCSVRANQILAVVSAQKSELELMSSSAEQVFQVCSQLLEEEDAKLGPEKRMSRKAFVVSMTLATMKEFISKEGLDVDALKETVKTLLTKEMFWQIPSSIPSAVGAWLDFLVTLNRHMPVKSGFNWKQVAAVTLESLDDENSAISSVAWNGLLEFLKDKEAFWNCADPYKAIVPKMISVITKGCYMKAEFACPCVVVVLSQLPNGSKAKKLEAYRTTLISLCDGFKVAISRKCVAREDFWLLQAFFDGVKLVLHKHRELFAKLFITVQEKIWAILDALVMFSVPGNDLFCTCVTFVAGLDMIFNAVQSPEWSDNLSKVLRQHLLAYFDEGAHNEANKALSLLVKVMLAAKQLCCQQLALECCAICWQALTLGRNRRLVPFLCRVIIDQFDVDLIRHVTHLDGSDENIAKLFILTMVRCILDWDAEAYSGVDAKDTIRLIFQASPLLPSEERHKVLHFLAEVQTAAMQQEILCQSYHFVNKDAEELWEDFVTLFMKYLRRCTAAADSGSVLVFLRYFSTELNMSPLQQQYILVELQNLLTEALSAFSTGKGDSDESFRALYTVCHFLAQMEPIMHLPVSEEFFELFTDVFQFYVRELDKLSDETQKRLDSVVHVFVQRQLSGKLPELWNKTVTIGRSVINEVCSSATPAKCVMLAEISYSVLRSSVATVTSNHPSPVDFDMRIVDWKSLGCFLPKRLDWEPAIVNFDREFPMKPLAVYQGTFPVDDVNTVIPSSVDFSSVYKSPVFAMSVYFTSLMDKILTNTTGHKEPDSRSNFLKQLSKSVPAVENGLFATLCTADFLVIVNRVIEHSNLSLEIRNWINCFQDSWQNVVACLDNELISHLLQNYLFDYMVLGGDSIFSMRLLSEIHFPHQKVVKAPAPMPSMYVDPLNQNLPHSPLAAKQKLFVELEVPDSSYMRSLKDAMCDAVNSGSKDSKLKLLNELSNSARQFVFFKPNPDEQSLILLAVLLRFVESTVGFLEQQDEDVRDFVLALLVTSLTNDFGEPSELKELVTLSAIRLLSAVCMKAKKVDREVADEWLRYLLGKSAAVLMRMFMKYSAFENPQACQTYLLQDICVAVDAVFDDITRMAAQEKELQDLLPLMIPQCFAVLENNRCRLCCRVTSFHILEKSIQYMVNSQRKPDPPTLGSLSDIPLPVQFVELLEKYDRDLIPKIMDMSCVLTGDPRFVEDLFSYLLFWKLVLEYLSNVRNDLRAGHVEYLQRSNILDKFLSSVTCLLPEELSFRKVDDSNPLGERIRSLALNPRQTIVLDPEQAYVRIPAFDPRNLVHLTFLAFFRSFQIIPAAVRQWWTNLEKTKSADVKRFVVKYISKVLCRQEIQIVIDGQKKYDKLKLIPRLHTHEVLAAYQNEEFRMEMSVVLPVDYPLSPPNVVVNKRVHVAKEKWRRWMLNLMTFVVHQNGSIRDAILVWKKCFEKFLEGIDSCMICMMVIHSTYYTVPTVSCKQCKKKFHGECLRTWFDTSNNTACPLCRHLF